MKLIEEDKIGETDIIRFDAKVDGYVKGYFGKNYCKHPKSIKYDYNLINLKNIRRIFKMEEFIKTKNNIIENTNGNKYEIICSSEDYHVLKNLSSSIKEIVVVNGLTKNENDDKYTWAFGFYFGNYSRGHLIKAISLFRDKIVSNLFDGI